MNIRIIKTLGLSCLLIIGFTKTHAQVTIGSDDIPLSGSLLDLKESGTTKRGLALPRVSLISNSSLEPCLTGTEAADPSEKRVHTGLMVYNVGKVVETSAQERLCKGAHVWDGNKWVPLKPYPDFSALLGKAGPREDLVDVRGPGDSEVNTYHTAYFVGVQKPYACEPSNKMFDAGVWMTTNLNTHYMPGETIRLPDHALVQDDHYNPQFTDPLNPGLTSPTNDERIKLNGLLYNWVAATNGKDLDRDLGSEFMIADQAQVQGICPEGWHLPSSYEWRQLMEAVRATPELYSDGTEKWAIPLKAKENGGSSKTGKDGGLAMILTGAAIKEKGKHLYNEEAAFWTSSSYNPDNDHNNGRGYRAKYSLVEKVISKNQEILTGRTEAASLDNAANLFGQYSANSRVFLYSVRCKKDN